MNNFFILISISIFFLFSCAEQIPPSGGKKDITAPKVKFFSPENYSTNFHYSKIEIKFDEFIKFASSGGNIIISPSINKQPKYELLGKKIRITFQEMLQKNTTYIINFGNSIKDYNEGNELKNFKYVFSTGNIIDSLSIKGKVFNAFNNKPIENVIVGLYLQEEDSVLYKKPLYFINTNKNGEYSIENIKKGSYKIACLKDKNLNYIFDQPTEKIGFIDSIYYVNKNLTNKNLFLFEEIEEEKILNYNNETNNLIVFNFNKPFLNLTLDVSNYQKEDIYYHSLDKKQLNYWYVNRDSLVSNFVFNKSDSFSLVLKEDKQNTPFNFTVSTNIINKKNTIILDFPFPIKELDNSKIRIKSKTKEHFFTTNWTNNNKTLELTTSIIEDTVILISNRGAFISFHNKISEQHKDTINTFKSNYSNIILKFKKQDQLILELYNTKEKLIAVKNVSRETKTTFYNLKSGKYFIRIFQDKNNDFIWNTGLFHVKQQAEKTLLYKEIEVKDNWDMEVKLEF